jgi:hypothetical protein
MRLHTLKTHQRADRLPSEGRNVRFPTLGQITCEGEESSMSTMHIATATRSYVRSVERIAAKAPDPALAERLLTAAVSMRIALEMLPEGSPHQLFELRNRAAAIARIPRAGSTAHTSLLAAHAVFAERAAEWALVCGLGTRPAPV